MMLYITGMVHPFKLSASSPFKRAHLCSSASILWRSCSQASSCLCWEADMVFSSFSRSFSSAISNWSSLLCRWTVEPFRSFTGHFDETQRSDNSQKILERHKFNMIIKGVKREIIHLNSFVGKVRIQWILFLLTVDACWKLTPVSDIGREYWGDAEVEGECILMVATDWMASREAKPLF